MFKAVKRIFVLSLLCSASYVLSQPPFPFFFLSYVCLVPLLWMVEGSPRRDLISGWLAGLATQAGLVYWTIIAMTKYGGLGLLPSLFIFCLFISYLAAYTGAFTVCLSLLKTRLGVSLYLSGPPLFVLFEFLRGVLFTGFPWSLLAHSHHNVLPFIQIASITGSYFLSFLIASANAIVFSLARRERIPLFFVGCVCALFVLSFLYGIGRLRTPIAAPFSCSLVQGNIRQDMKWGKEMAAIITARYCSLTARERDADLVVWPETALPFVFEDASWARQMVEQASSQLKGYLLLGAFSREDDRFYNATFMLRHGRVTGLYRKVHLVPFGEYTPFLRYLPFREWVKRHVAELSSGEGHNPLKMLSGNVGVLICYEGIFPAISRKTVKNGAQILINVTNDAWYDRSSAPYQHMAFYVFRAVETDRFVLRAANTGVSAIIDPRGRLIQRSRIFEETAVRGRFSFRSTETFYVRYGEWFLLLCLFYLLIILLVHARHLR